MVLVNSYNFTLEQTAGYEIDHKPCNYEHKVDVTFQVNMTYNSASQLEFSIKQTNIKLGEYFKQNGYKEALIASLESAMAATYSSSELFSTPLEKTMNTWAKSYDLKTLLFGNEFKSTNTALTFA